MLRLLQREGRLSAAEIGRRIGLSASPVQRRLSLLEDSGAIRGYRADIDLAVIGRGLDVVVWVELETASADMIEQFETEICALEEVSDLRRLFGSPDYAAVVSVRDVTAYEEFRMEQLGRLPHVRAITSQLTMKHIKRS